MKRWQALVLGIVVSVLALALALRNADFAAIGAAFSQANYGWVAASYVLFIGLILIRALRWSVLTEGRLDLREAFWLFNIGYLFNNVLPARLGEAVRAVLAGRRPQMQFGSAVSTIVVERLFDMVAVVLQLVVVIILLDLPAWATQAGLLMGSIAVTGVVVLAIAARRPEWALNLGIRLLTIAPFLDEDQARDFLTPFITGLAGVSNLRVFGLGLGLSILGWVASGTMAWVLLHAFFESPGFIMGQLAVAVGGMGIAVPAAPSGVGPFHAAVIETLSAVGFNRNGAISYAFLLHAASFLIPVGLGLLGLLREGLSFSEAVDLTK